MLLLDALDRASEEFLARLEPVSGPAWSAPTPCEDWDVHYLVAHVVGGNRFAVLVMDGMSGAEAVETVMSFPQLGQEPTEDYRKSVARQRDRFGRADMTLEVDHPMGRMTVERFLGMRVFDVAVHAWDLSQATGASDVLDAELVATVLGIVEREPEGMGFGITRLRQTSAEASPQDRLLDLTGRRRP